MKIKRIGYVVSSLTVIWLCSYIDKDLAKDDWRIFPLVCTGLVTSLVFIFACIESFINKD